MLEIRYHDTHMRYVTFPYTTEAGPSLPLLPHPALLRAHVRTRLTALYGRKRLAGRLTQRLAAISLTTWAGLLRPGTFPEGQDFWAVEIACLRLLQWRMQAFLCCHHQRTWEQAAYDLLPLLQIGYDYAIHARRRPWEQLRARCWN